MRLKGPTPSVLVETALGEADRAGDAEHPGQTHAGHEVDLAWLRAIANTLRSTADLDSAPTADCLDDEKIASLTHGTAGQAGGASLVHLETCVRCRGRLGGVVRLLGDDVVAAEIARLERSTPARGRGRRALVPAAAGVALAAAVLTGILLLPTRVTQRDIIGPDDIRHREPAITMTAAPRILAPTGAALPGDTLRWTSVVHADRYRVRVFDRDGTLVWDPETRDTAIAIAPHLTRSPGTTYQWKVEARTGWDRWVASEWAELTIGGGAER